MQPSDSRREKEVSFFAAACVFLSVFANGVSVVFITEQTE